TSWIVTAGISTAPSSSDSSLGGTQQLRPSSQSDKHCAMISSGETHGVTSLTQSTQLFTGSDPGVPGSFRVPSRVSSVLLFWIEHAPTSSSHCSHNSPFFVDVGTPNNVARTNALRNRRMIHPIRLAN